MRVFWKAKDELFVDDDDIAVLPLGIELDRSHLKVRIYLLDALQTSLLFVHLMQPLKTLRLTDPSSAAWHPVCPRQPVSSMLPVG